MWEIFWRRVVTLAREYPSLWFPVIFADAAGFGLKSARPVVAFHLLQFLFLGHSALGFTTVDHSATRTALAYALSGVLVQVVRIASIVLYAAAFLFTARLAMERIGVQKTDEKKLIKRALLLGLRAYLVAIPLSLVGFFPIYFSSFQPRWHAIVTHWLFADLLGLLVMSVLAYVMVPAALRALTDSTMTQPDRSSVRIGRKCAIAAVIASTSIMILEQIIVRGVRVDHASTQMIQTIESVINALPYAPLYLALTLLARIEQLEQVGESTGFAGAEA